MARKKRNQTNWTQIGHYAFFLGIILAVIAGLFSGMIGDEVVLTLLLLLGAIVGLLNITAKETTAFLVAAIALMIVGIGATDISQNFPLFGDYLYDVLVNIIRFVIPAAVIVSLKSIFMLAKEA